MKLLSALLFTAIAIVAYPSYTYARVYRSQCTMTKLPPGADDPNYSINFDDSNGLFFIETDRHLMQLRVTNVARTGELGQYESVVAINRSHTFSVDFQHLDYFPNKGDPDVMESISSFARDGSKATDICYPDHR